MRGREKILAVREKTCEILTLKRGKQKTVEKELLSHTENPLKVRDYVSQVRPGSITVFFSCFFIYSS